MSQSSNGPLAAAGETEKQARQENAIGEVQIYKLRLHGEHSAALGLPKDVCLALGMAPGQSFVAVRAVGPCLVISRATDVSSAESRMAEADAELARAIAVWEAAK